MSGMEEKMDALGAQISMDSPRTDEEASTGSSSKQSASSKFLTSKSRRLKRAIISQLNVTELPPKEETPSTQIEIPEINELKLPSGKRYHLKGEDLLVLGELGSGNGGTVSVVEYKPTGYKMAVKSMQLDSYETIYKQVQRELKIMHQCCSPYIVIFYGALLGNGEVLLCMEYMDVGSFDQIVKATGKIPIEIIGQITKSVLSGLVYLYSNHKIIHRDIKPSNILINSDGLIKISDFGVSVQLIDSIAQTFIGTSAYMSPERIEGSKYSVRSDAWSVGITLMELAIGKSPFLVDDDQLSVFDLLQIIVREPSPTLPTGAFPADFEAFLSRCLIKEPSLRPTPLELLEDPYCVRVSSENVDVKSWTSKIESIIRSKKVH